MREGTCLLGLGLWLCNKTASSSCTGPTLDSNLAVVLTDFLLEMMCVPTEVGVSCEGSCLTAPDTVSPNSPSLPAVQREEL